MDTIWNIVAVFGLVSLFLLIVGIWTHLDMQREECKKQLIPDAKFERNP